MSNYKEEILEYLKVIENEIGDEEAVYGALAGLNSVITPLLEKLDEEDFYLWGLAHYSILTEPIENSMFKFQKSLQLNPDFQLSRLYLAHCYHDKEEWYDALEEYLKVDQEKLIEDFPAWRVATLNEQIGYCYWKIEQIDEAMRFFERVKEIWNEYKSESFIKPSDMIECLGVNHNLLEDVDLSKMM